MHAENTDTTEVATDADVRGHDVISDASDETPRRLSSWFAIGAGLCAIILNIALAIRIWKFIFAKTAYGSLLFSLMISGFVIGIFLIGYGVLLQRSRAQRVGAARAEGFWYLSVATTLLVAVGAFVVTIWAANVVEPDQPGTTTPKACIDLYQQAVAIHQASPSFTFPAGDPDQRRCDLNGFVKRIGR